MGLIYLKESVDNAKRDWILSKLQDSSIPWDWGVLSSNTNITWDIVQAFSDKPWDWNKLSGNPSITWDIVQANPDKRWRWSSLSQNSNVLRYPLVEIESTVWRFIATRRIQRAFKEAYCNPEYKMCRERLMRDFARMAKDLDLKA